MRKNYQPLTDFDREFWESELEDFVPRRIFDAHTHLWSDALAPGAGVTIEEVGFDDLDKWSKEVFPGRETGYLLLPYPAAGMDAEKTHLFMAREIAKSRHRRGSTIVTPEITPEDLDEAIKKHHFFGLKPYRSFAADPANCRITDFFPESLIEAADHHGLCVTLHMARFDGAADPENLRDLARLTKRYPRVRWILAHCARAFNPYTLEKSIFRLAEMEHTVFDLSAVCSTRSFYLLFKHIDTSRLLFGTDNICAGGVHGSYVNWGRAWQFIRPAPVTHCRPDATLVCYESLSAVKQAADMAGLTTDQIEDIFCGNAEKFFGL